MNLPVIDMVFTIVIIALALFGMINGFINEVMGKIIPIVSIWIAFMTFRYVVEPIEKNVNMHFVAVVLAFLMVFIACFIVLKILQLILKSIFSGYVLKSLDRFLGLVAGAFEGIALVCVVLIVLLAQPWFDTNSLLAGSIYLKLLGPVISIPLNVLNESLNGTKTAFLNCLGAMNV